MTDDIVTRLRAQKTVQQMVQAWQQKDFAEKQADFEYLAGYRELMFGFIRSKDLFGEWTDYFAASFDHT